MAVGDVPIDVLAERLATTRGGLYKTIHDARNKLRRRFSGGRSSHRRRSGGTPVTGINNDIVLTRAALRRLLGPAGPELARDECVLSCSTRSSHACGRPGRRVSNPLTDIADVGIELPSITDELERDGIKSSCNSYRQRLDYMESKLGAVAGQTTSARPSG